MSVDVGISGESNGDSNGDWNALRGVVVAVGVVVEVKVGVAVGEAERVTRLGDGEGSDSSVAKPQLERNVANAAAPAPCRNLRRSMGNSIVDMLSIVTADFVRVNHVWATDRLRPAYTFIADLGQQMAGVPLSALILQ
jgi:hypothetical protein